MLSINGLVKVYGEQYAVNNLSFEAKKGEILGFLGPNGAGKSTTMKIATCYLAATSGSVEVCGIEVNKNPLGVRKKIGYLPEHNPLYLDMYVREYLSYMGKFYQIPHTALRKRIEEIIELVQLGRESHKLLRQLSKGYRQRVGLAQALLHNPEVLILDEPTTGLDPNQTVEMRQVIKSISAAKTIVFSTHIMQEVQALCDRVVIINKGEKVLDTTIESLQQAQQEVLLSVQTENPISQDDWLSIDGVQSVKIDAHDAKSVKLTSSYDNRRAVFLYVASQGNVLLEMSEQKKSLEHVFQELTKAKDNL